MYTREYYLVYVKYKEWNNKFTVGGNKFTGYFVDEKTKTIFFS